MYKKSLAYMLTFVLIIAGVFAAALAAEPVVEVSEPLTVKRSEIVNREFMDWDKSNVDEAWGAYGDYNTWEKAGIVDMLSKITINGKSITPQDGDDFPWWQLYNAMGPGGVTSFKNKLNGVPVLCLKVRNVPDNLPLSAHPLIIDENEYTPPYTFTTNYSLDYSIYEPLFINDFTVIDDYRQLAFEFAPSDDGETHGRFTGEEKLITLAKYQDTKVPNNVVGLVQGQSMEEAGLEIPEYELDKGWEISKITDETGKEYTKSQVLSLHVVDNQTFTIHLIQPVKEVVVPAVWYPVDVNTGEVIPGLRPNPTYPDMYPDSEVAILKKGEYKIDLNGTISKNSANNFLITSSIMFTDQFHKVVAQGRDVPEGVSRNSYVYSITYGDETFKDFDMGIHGMTVTPYNEGETMNLYLAVYEDQELSEATYKEGDVEITNKMTDDEIRQALIDHVEKVDYLDLKVDTAEESEILELDLKNLDKLFIFDHNTGKFISDGDNYKDFIATEGDIASLPDGKYEAVYPIYWQYNFPAWWCGANKFPRYRYKIDDTFHFTFTKKSLVDINVEKAWEDSENQDGLRPENVEVQLYVGNEAVEGKTLTLNAENNWTGAFENLPKYKGGEEIAYTVKETSVPKDYESGLRGSMEDGFTITNSHTPETVSVTGAKTWEGEGKLPESISINLLKNGVKIEAKKVTEADSWKWSFEGLPKYEDGKEISYTIAEDEVKDYTSKVDGYNITNTYITPEPTQEPTQEPTAAPTAKPTAPPKPSYPTLSVPLNVKKTFKNAKLYDGQFAFELKDRNGKVIAEAKNKADGTVAFPDRTFSKEVANWTYTINEVKGEDKNIVYDDTVYTVMVTTKAAGGKLEAEISLKKDGIPYDGDIVFKNSAKAPQTGDSIYQTLGILISVSVLLAAAAYMLNRKRTNI
jgi:pilin isopeptide linkage protein